jgi:hypothetical protein
MEDNIENLSDAALLTLVIEGNADLNKNQIEALRIRDGADYGSAIHELDIQKINSKKSPY